jgi:hypothetical protein
MRLFSRLACWFTGHEDMTSFSAEHRTMRLVCVKCQRRTSGWTIDAKRPVPIRAKSRTWWLNAVYYGKGA